MTESSAGRAHRATETLHAMIYFAPEGELFYGAIGLRPGRMGYFASRSAAMGAVSASVTAATFYNFNPELVARFIPRAWTLATPEAILQARLQAVDLALRRVLVDEIDTPDVRELAELTREATTALRPEARPLYAAHAELPWPVEPHLALWHAVTLLREYRGDGHLMALSYAGLNGIESIVTHSATGRGFTVEAAKKLRGWSDEQWAATLSDLEKRGLMDGDKLTDEGMALRDKVERDTDELDRAPWEHLGPDGTAQVIELGKSLSRVALQNGAFPSRGVFSGRA